MSRRSKYFKEKKYTVLKEIVKKKCKKYIIIICFKTINSYFIELNL